MQSKRKIPTAFKNLPTAFKNLGTAFKKIICKIITYCVQEGTEFSGVLRLRIWVLRLRIIG